MKTAKKYSPIDFAIEEAEHEDRHGWTMAQALKYSGPNRLVDLSHISKWDVQGPTIDDFPFPGIQVPLNPGECVVRQNLLTIRMNASQCAVWDMDGMEAEPPNKTGITDVTSGLALLAICGPATLLLMERISNLDLTLPHLKMPCLFQGPVLGIPCLVILLARDAESSTVLTAFPRGYGQAMAKTLLSTGADWEFRPRQIVPG